MAFRLPECYIDPMPCPKRRPAQVLASIIFIFLAASCIRYQSRPIETSGTANEFEARSLFSPELRDFLLANKEVSDWPPAAWNIKALTLAAFYYSPDMDVARAQWGVARAGRITAGERINPALNPLLGYNVTSPASEVTPWIPEIALEITIETAGKRGIRIASARQISESARWNVLSVAWDVRSRLRGALLDLYGAERTASLLADRKDAQDEIVRLLEIQKRAGEVSAYETLQARVALDNSRLASIEAARTAEDARARLAASLGVPRKALEGIALSYDGFERPSPDIPTGEVRLHALENRTDILSALSEYESTQSALRLEIAKQYPDIRLGPNYQLDQTDSKWTIGLSFDLPILSRNKGPIAEAEARRAESAARFMALQARVIGELAAAIEDCRSAILKAKAADDLLEHLIAQEAAAKPRWELGEISKLDYLAIRIELNAGALARLDALIQAQQTIGRLEDAAQSPLDVKDWITGEIPRGAGPAKERKNE
jgi:outer membrane protein, heavy metal efflux system